ncbi:hypothetical protein BKA69DRAFT_1078468 [Paraphysoderma sedebokerense]|nr:hypothetical protein BKA69DRAFT_1078468 [Paraphysoderma sedebokerense]
MDYSSQLELASAILAEKSAGAKVQAKTTSLSAFDSNDSLPLQSIGKSMNDMNSSNNSNSISRKESKASLDVISEEIEYTPQVNLDVTDTVEVGETHETTLQSDLDHNIKLSPHYVDSSGLEWNEAVQHYRMNLVPQDDSTPPLPPNSGSDDEQELQRILAKPTTEIDNIIADADSSISSLDVIPSTDLSATSPIPGIYPSQPISAFDALGELEHENPRASLVQSESDNSSSVEGGSESCSIKDSSQNPSNELRSNTPTTAESTPPNSTLNLYDMQQLSNRLSSSQQESGVTSGSGSGSSSSLSESGRTSSLSYNPYVTVPGLTGLQNMGNTCYQNTILQCLSKTVPLIEYILSLGYLSDINRDNPLGSKGVFISAFAEVINQIYGESPYYTPSDFKTTVDKLSCTFDGNDQQDVLDFLEFCLDKLHEDLNRILKRPYKEIGDYDDSIPDEVHSRNQWDYFKSREDSIIIDHFQGQYKSTLRCLQCDKVSKTFDPFRVLSVPLPEEPEVYQFIMIYVNGSMIRYEAQVPQNATGAYLKQLILDYSEPKLSAEELIVTCADDLSLSVIDDADIISRTTRGNSILAYQILPQYVKIVVSHYFHRGNGDWCGQLIPMVLSIQPGRVEKFSHLYRHVYRRLKAIISFEEIDDTASQEPAFFIYPENDVRHDYLPLTEYDPPETEPRPRQINWDEKVALLDGQEFFVIWKPEVASKMIPLREKVIDGNPSVLSRQPIIPADGLNLNHCLQLFAKEEVLEGDEAWYCPRCKSPQNAKKQLSITRLPNILVINLKRFAVMNGMYGYPIRQKLETSISFPLKDLDMSEYVENFEGKNEDCIYDLYAVANHWGSIYGGHYTAACKYSQLFSASGKDTPNSTDSNVNLDDIWFEYDDWKVERIDNPESVVSKQAYLLFYQRRNMAKPQKQNRHRHMDLSDAELQDLTKELMRGLSIHESEMTLVANESDIAPSNVMDDAVTDETFMTLPKDDLPSVIESQPHWSSTSAHIFPDSLKSHSADLPTAAELNTVSSTLISSDSVDELLEQVKSVGSPHPLYSPPPTRRVVVNPKASVSIESLAEEA